MRDENFSVKSLSCRGIRLLSQHPLETLIAFICSSNNNIERIQLMMRNLARELGEHICDHGGVAYHSFPSLSKLSGSGVEDVLTRIGFGYRAKYVYQTALKLERELGGEDWLSELKRKSYEGGNIIIPVLWMFSVVHVLARLCERVTLYIQMRGSHFKTFPGLAGKWRTASVWPV